ncbi:hypothetical protein CUR21_02995 [Pseudorhodobacter sp. MZDSW-24AT]|nr:hypothetical protein CUR21_02995 [Pseudorhodobacter sp. MZDSW-24AT]
MELMMSTTKRAAAAVLAAMVTAGSAQAASYTFDFTTSTQSWLETISFGSLQDPAMKKARSGATQQDKTGLRRQDAAAAMRKGAVRGVCGDLAKTGHVCVQKNLGLHSKSPDDLAVFVFETAMSVTSMSYSYFDSVFAPAKYAYQKASCKTKVQDACKVWNYGYVLVVPPQTKFDMFDLFLSADDVRRRLVAPRLAFADAPSARRFGIGAPESTEGFGIAGLTAQPAPEPEEVPSPVPLPAGGLLLLAALGGVASAARRSRAG